jgi:ATP-dependent DNA ligase
MFRRRKHAISEASRDVPVGLFCFDLLYADGEYLTRLPYPQRRARLAQAITPAAGLQLTTAVRSALPATSTPPSSRRSRTAARGCCASQ